MKLLILTQKIDKQDPILGFFHGWVLELSKKFEKVSVVCLQEGDFNLPENVRIYSLGKKNKKLPVLSRTKYLANFYGYILGLHADYDAVFVHMNQEYILFGGLFWKIMGKNIYMWRNHHAGSLLTDIAAMYCDKVFCTSKYSYTAKYKKTILMPVGVDLRRFTLPMNGEESRTKNSILFLGRIAETKNVHIFVEALGILKERGTIFTADIYGDALTKDRSYREKLKTRASELDLDRVLKFHEGVPNNKTPEIYSSHEIFVNLSSSGMYDKTIFEAFACDCVVVVSNDNLMGEIDLRFIIKERTAKEVADILQIAIGLTEVEKGVITSNNTKFTTKHSLETLVEKLQLEMKS